MKNSVSDLIYISFGLTVKKELLIEVLKNLKWSILPIYMYYIYKYSIHLLQLSNSNYIIKIEFKQLIKLQNTEHE